MQNAERYAIAAVINGLRKSGSIDNEALDVIAAELERAAIDASNYCATSPTAIRALAADVREMRID